MCGRFSLFADAEELAEAFDLSDPPRLEPRYNIVPAEEVAAVGRASADRPRSLARLRWGLIPFWVDDPEDFEPTLINARAETVADKPSFREPFRRRRCVIPASGFFEWQETSEGKQPYFVRPGGEHPFGFAGLWDRWEGEDLAVNSCAIITTEADGELEEIHERMPVILSPGDYDTWLDPGERNVRQLRNLMGAYPLEDVRVHRVRRRVNDPTHDDPDCVRPLVDEPTEEGESGGGS